MVWLFFGIAIFAFYRSCTSSDDANDKARYDVTVNQVQVSADKGLDLKAVGEVLKKAKDAAEFEALLNSPDSQVNNLDLNEDGKVDYIKVTEFGDEKVKGFSLTTELGPDDVQEIATIKIEKRPDAKGEADVQYHGNPNIYGQGYYYRSHWSPGLGTGLMLGYLWGGHRSYYSPYGYNRYPSNYRSYPTTTPSRYAGRWQGRTGSNYGASTKSGMGAGVNSPNAGRTSNNVKAKLKNPTASQKSFQTRSRAAATRSGGFGRSSSSTRSTGSSSSVRGRSSGSRFSGGK